MNMSGIANPCRSYLSGDAPRSRIQEKAGVKLKISIASRDLLCYHHIVAAKRGLDKKYQVKDILTRWNKRVSI